jgi:hypothetical protein
LGFAQPDARAVRFMPTDFNCPLLLISVVTSTVEQGGIVGRSQEYYVVTMSEAFKSGEERARAGPFALSSEMALSRRKTDDLDTD